MIRSKKIRNAAKEQDCTLNIAGFCNYNPETTVFCHFPDESKGMGIKSDDICGGFGCSSCHDVIDGRRKHSLTDYEIEWYLRRSMVRTWRILIEKGIIKI